MYNSRILFSTLNSITNGETKDNLFVKSKGKSKDKRLRVD